MSQKEHEAFVAGVYTGLNVYGNLVFDKLEKLKANPSVADPGKLVGYFACLRDIGNAMPNDEKAWEIFQDKFRSGSIKL